MSGGPGFEASKTSPANSGASATEGSQAVAVSSHRVMALYRRGVESAPDNTPSRAYVRAALGTNALRRLGRSIASGQELTADEYQLYRAFIADADARRQVAQLAIDVILRSTVDVMPNAATAINSGRTKTLKTLREKLIRSPHEALPSIRDIAGVRVVVDCSLVELRALAGVLAQTMTAPSQFDRVAEFTGAAKVIDRLTEPMHGYRAIHLVVRLDGAPVEVQIRTSLQHSWAALMELLCDRWGREPRYGEPLVEPDPAVRAAKLAVLDEMQRVSQTIATFEDATASLGIVHINLDWETSGAGVTPAQWQETYDRYQAMEPHLAEAKVAMRQSLERLGETVDAIGNVQGEAQ